MRAVGIIAEYNPFHNGHLWHVEQAKKRSGCEAVVAVMSGNFLQRGEPASFDKWLRSKMAVLGGVDLVLELPAVFAIRSAQYFAAGGIRLLSSLGAISHICFGAETDDMNLLKEAAVSFGTLSAKEAFKDNMKEGLTYAKAMTLAVSDTTGINQEVLSSPNNILAIEYLRAINKYAPSITPIAVKRHQAQYHDSEITSSYASATAIRKALEISGNLEELIINAIPPSTHDVIRDALKQELGPARIERLSNTILFLLRSIPYEHLQQIADVNEGLHNKLRSSAVLASSINQLIDLIKSKRYPKTRLQRILIHTLLGTKKSDLAFYDETGPLYARILAFNDIGRLLLKKISQETSLPLITKTTAVLNSKIRDTMCMTPAQKMLAVDTLASDAYVFTLPNPDWYFGGWDFVHSPSYIPFRSATV